MTCWTIFFANASGCSRASATVAGSSGQPGAGVVKPLSLEEFPPRLPAARQQPQAVHEEHRREVRVVGAVDLGTSQSASVDRRCRSSWILSTSACPARPRLRLCLPPVDAPESSSRCNAVFTSARGVPRSRVICRYQATRRSRGRRAAGRSPSGSGRPSAADLAVAGSAERLAVIRPQGVGVASRRFRLELRRHRPALRGVDRDRRRARRRARRAPLGSRRRGRGRHR